MRHAARGEFAYSGMVYLFTENRLTSPGFWYQFIAGNHYWLGVGFGSINASHRKFLNVRLVPEAEVNLSILNVGFGDVSYQGVKESGAAYIGMGG